MKLKVNCTQDAQAWLGMRLDYSLVLDFAKPKMKNTLTLNRFVCIVTENGT